MSRRVPWSHHPLSLAVRLGQRYDASNHRQNANDDVENTTKRKEDGQGDTDGDEEEEVGGETSGCSDLPLARGELAPAFG